MPDELLAAVDAEASRQGTTRSGLLQHLAGEALVDRDAERARRIQELYEGVELTDHGGNAVELLKEERLKR